MTAAEKLDRIMAAIEAGKTVYISTGWRTIKVTARDVAKFEAIGRPLFKATAKSLYISSGKRYDCIDYCRISC